MNDIVVLPGREKLSLEWKQTDPERYQRRLKAKHADNSKAGPGEKAHCLCVHQGRYLELQIKQRGETYHFACMQNTGPYHQPTCPFYKPNPEKSGQAAYVEGVVKEDTEHEVSVKLISSLKRNSPVNSQAPSSTPVGTRSGGKTQRRMTTLGLLHLLWERAGLHYWRPQFNGHRTDSKALRRAYATSRNIKIQHGIRLDQVLCPVVSDDRNILYSTHRTIRNHSEKLRLYVIGRLSSAQANPYGKGQNIELAGIRDGYRMFMTISQSRWERVERSYPRELAEFFRNEEGLSVFGLFLVTIDPIKKGKYTNFSTVQVDDAALMTTTDQLIPVESRFEANIADLLVNQKRSFIKPLRFDATRDLVRPDFILTDVREREGCPMEVFGRTDEKYLARKAEKESYYARVFGSDNWWSWDAAHNAPIPPFPDAF
ncbi:DUF1173 family protein (plasmid) [Acetobacter sp. AC2005]|uniref:DUF1173 family protein n=1 Tax=Acetobacter sp. AC2005 TaxID=3134142 RepID=UPI0030D2EF57